MMRSSAARAAGAVLALLCGCGGDNPVEPQPTPAPSAIPGAGTGPTEIVFVSAEPAVGSTLSGCGATADGCAGRIRMRFSLRPTRSGPALSFSAFLHSDRLQACLLAALPGFQLQAGVATTVDVVFDRSDRCATPVTIRNMAAVVEGTVDVASRQEWALGYTLLP
jgi:hypothetical protein